jgi:hypothetical protein
MQVKSLPTFKHSSIGKTTHKARTATRHMSYIMRSQAMTEFQAENMPDGGRGTRVYFDRIAERPESPANARVVDKLMIALPAEMTAEQRYEALASFMEKIGQGRIAWCAAHHDAGEDAHNPHAHVVFRDADIVTGRKVVGTTTSASDVREAKEHGWKVPPRTTTKELRYAWCEHLNAAMEKAGIDVRYDPRALKAQGIDREPQIHIGPKALALKEKGHEFASQDAVRNKRGIPYTLLDQENRAEHNARIVGWNKERKRATGQGRHSLPDPRTPEGAELCDLGNSQTKARRQMYLDQRDDRAALRRVHDAQKAQLKTRGKTLYAKAREKALRSVKEQNEEKWKAVRGLRTAKERSAAAKALRKEQKALYATVSAAEIGRVRTAKDKAWKAMLKQQEKERGKLRDTHRQEQLSLARHQVAAKLATHEKWRTIKLDRASGALGARLEARQSMATQQDAAIDTMRLRARANSVKGIHGAIAVPANPRAAVAAWREIARNDYDARASIRRVLNGERASNYRRAAELGQNGKGQTQDRSRAASPQEQARQAVMSGRPLTDAERLNASPEVRESLGRQDRSAKERSVFSMATAQQQRGDGGRQGGGRGR